MEQNPKQYEITIERLEPNPDNTKYPNKVEIYKQQVEEVDLLSVILAVNGLSKFTPTDRKMISALLASPEEAPRHVKD